MTKTTKPPQTDADLLAQALRELNELRAENDRFRAALDRIEGMAERPVCICGVQTGTAAIKQAARTALSKDHAG